MSTGFTLPITATDGGTINGTIRLINTLDKKIADSAKKSMEAFDAAAKKADAAAKRVEQANEASANTPGGTKFTLHSEIAQFKKLADAMRRFRKDLEASGLSKQRKEYETLTKEVRDYDKGIAEANAAMRIGLHAKNADIAATEKQSKAYHTASAELRNYNATADRATELSKALLYAKRAPVRAEAQLVRDTSDTRQDFKNLKDPRYMANERQKITNAGLKEAALLESKLSEETIKLTAASTNHARAIAARNEVMRITNRAYLEEATAGAQLNATLAKMAREAKNLSDPKRILVEKAKIMAKALLDEKTAGEQLNVMLGKMRREVETLNNPLRIAAENAKIAAKASFDSATAAAREEAALKRMATELTTTNYAERERIRLLKERAQAQAVLDTRRANPTDFKGTIALKEQARLERELALLQARRSGGMPVLIAQIKRLREEEDKATFSTKKLNIQMHLNQQAAAAMRSALYGLGTSFGMYTSATLLTATAMFAIASAFREAVRSALEYEKALSELSAFASRNPFGSVQYAADLKDLDETVRGVANSSKYMVGEVADAAKQLALAGLSVEQVNKAIPSTMRLATIGALDFGQAADIATNVMMGFRLSVKDLPRIVNVFSKAATESNTNVEQLGTAMSYAAPLAESFGVSLEYTTAAMEVLANAGIKASRAGTGMRRIFLSLFTPAKEAAELVEGFGISLGQFGDIEGLDGLTDMAVELGNAGKGSKQLQEMLREFSIATAGGTKNLDLLRKTAGVYATPAFTQLVKSVGMGTQSVQAFAKGLTEAEGSSRDQLQKMTENFLSLKDAIVASLTVISAGMYDEFKESIITTAKEVLAVTRAIAANKDTVGEFYEALIAGGKAVALFVAGLVALKLALFAIKLVLGAVSGALTVVTKTVAMFAGMKLAFAAGGAALGILAAKLLAVAAALGGLYLAGKWVYNQFLGMPEVIDKVGAAYDSFKEAQKKAHDQTMNEFEAEQLGRGILELFKQQGDLQKSMADGTERTAEETQTLADKLKQVGKEIEANTQAQNQFAQAGLTARMAEKQAEIEILQIRAAGNQAGLANLPKKLAQAEMSGLGLGREREQEMMKAAKQVAAASGVEIGVQTRLLDLLVRQKAAYAELDEAKKKALFAELDSEIDASVKAWDEYYRSIQEAGLATEGMEAHMNLLVNAIREARKLSTGMGGELGRVAATPAEVWAASDKAMTDYHAKLKLISGTELQRKTAALDAARAAEAQARADFDRARDANTTMRSTIKLLDAQGLSTTYLNVRQEELHADMLTFSNRHLKAREDLTNAEKAHQSELDSTSKAQDKVTKTAYDWHMANVQLLKDLEDLRRSMMDLTEQTLARGTQFFSDITAGAGIAAKAFRQVTLSGEEMSQSVVQSVEAAQTMRAGGGAAATGARYPYQSTIEATAGREGFPSWALAGVLSQESGFNPRAVGDNNNSWGMGQFNRRGAAAEYGVSRSDILGMSAERQIALAGNFLGKKIRQSGGDVEGGIRRYNGGGDPNYVSNVHQRLRGLGISPTSQSSSLTQQTSALVDESKRVTYLTADEKELAEARKAAAAAARDEFSIGKHIEELRQTEITTQAALRNAYQEVHYWNQELAAGRVEEVSQREAMKAATDVYTATLQHNSQARENQLKWEEYGIRTNKLTELQVQRTAEELDLLGEKYGQGQKEVKDFTYAKLELDLAYTKNAISSRDYEMALSRELTKVAQAKGEYAAFFDSMRYDSEDFAKIGVQAFTDLRDAMAEAFAGGKWNFEKMLTGMRDAAAKFAADQVMQGLFAPKDAKTGAGGGLLTGLGSMLTKGVMSFFATGGAVQAALPHGIYTGPTLFPMAGSGMRAFASGTGLLGEAGPEAVLPLVRGSGGDLGVKAQTAAPVVNVVVNTRPGETAKVRQDGNTLTIDIIEQTLASRVMGGGTALPRAMEAAYGSRRT